MKRRALSMVALAFSAVALAGCSLLQGSAKADACATLRPMVTSVESQMRSVSSEPVTKEVIDAHAPAVDELLDEMRRVAGPDDLKALVGDYAEKTKGVVSAAGQATSGGSTAPLIVAQSNVVLAMGRLFEYCEWR